MPNPSSYADDDDSASHSSAGFAVSSATERSLSDNKTVVPPPADSQLETASSTVFPWPIEPTLFPKESLSIEYKKKD